MAATMRPWCRLRCRRRHPAAECPLQLKSRLSALLAAGAAVYAVLGGAGGDGLVVVSPAVTDASFLDATRVRSLWSIFC
jgi:hypothetical protein